jgi:hypothetical protein
MATVVIQIGNSDDKLTQREWSDYWAAVETEVCDLAEKHFSGGSGTINPWQNYCWVLDMKDTDVPVLSNRLREVRERFRQDSVAMLVGDTQFI